ncbi:MAG TPA: EscU/YscU/HrcU family type III secretion system export apparatus switch protein [Acidimicrobiales bacterium]|nr:EscU/YscU/HrcU family type III secretion system export apparatus switch protein [Acidimicrobiales bacterium]
MAAGEVRSERPTPKRRSEARRQGRVARSAELASWLTLLVLAWALPALGGRAWSLAAGLAASLTAAAGAADPGQALALLARGLWTFLAASLPIVAAVAAAGLAANLAQVGFHLSPGALGFRLVRVSPSAGLRRIASSAGLFGLALGAARLALLAAAGYATVRRLVAELLAPGTLPLATTVTLGGAGLLALVREVAVAALVLAFADYAFQRHRHQASLKMTREEVRREARETELAPEVRRALRRRRRGLTRLQLLAAAANADVVVVNPTHYAAALAYDRTRDVAPRLVAKGADELALALKAAAVEHGVAVVEDRGLARALHDACEVGDLVPPRLYEAVARLLAFVYRLSPAARALVEVHHLAA